jgi:hypothetical protein
MPGPVDRPYLTPNRKVAALDIPLYAGEIVLETTAKKAYVAVPITPYGSWTSADWVEYGYGIGLN